jgi:membrane protein required for colicin V production
MNALDIIFLAVLGYTTFRGFFRGLIKEVSAIVGIFLAYVISNNYYTALKPHVGEIVVWESYVPAVSYGLMFLLVLLGIGFLGFTFRKSLQLANLSFFERLLGGVFGFLKGYLVCVLVMIALMLTLASGSKFLTQSRLAPYMAAFSAGLASYAPEEVQETLQEKSGALAKAWDTNNIRELFRPHD